jgi:catechol 2,3-dioxygenase-like lactoylglutathione lyase family enzyme
MTATAFQVTFDCADPDRLARFWAVALGYQLQDPPPGFDTWEAFLRDAGVPAEDWGSASSVVDPDGAGPRLYFQRVPEGKVAKNRVHLDLNVGGGRGVPEETRRANVDARVALLVEHGATRVGDMSRHGERWVVMRDPEGNELCVQ